MIVHSYNGIPHHNDLKQQVAVTPWKTSASITETDPK